MKTFIRYEKKYLLNDEKFNRLMDILDGKIKEDNFSKSTICNIYFDTSSFELIRHSLDKPVYKEKLRMRSYGVPEKDSKVFVELKKKYKGVVYKRREKMRLNDAEDYLYLGNYPEKDTQVLREIDWFMSHYKTIKPRMYISYDRVAMCGVEDEDLRITFDRNILWRDNFLDLKNGAWGNRIIHEDEHLMEIKINGGMPFWLCEVLNSLNIFPRSFSKYGVAYQMKQGHLDTIEYIDELSKEIFAC